MLRMTAIALAALLAAAGPAATAAPPPGGPHVTYHIVVNKAGERVRGSAGTSAQPVELGRRLALFPVDVTKCTYVATLGRGTRDGGINERGGFISAQRSSGFATGVFVETRGPFNRLRNRPFHLLVAC